MKTLLLNFGILTLTCLNISAQSTSKNSIHNSYTTKFGVPTLIKNVNTFYNKTSIEIKKETIKFSKNLDTITENRYKDSKLDAILIFIFNQNRNLIYRSFKNKIPLIGWRFSSTTYKYDQTGLIEQKTIDRNGNLKNIEIIKNDSLKNRILLKSFDSNNRLIGYETTEYQYKKNKSTWKVYNKHGKLMTKKTSLIDSKKNKLEKYNEFGDCILYPRNWSPNDNTYYQVVFKYDKLGNWIEKKIYKVNKIGRKFKNKKINRKFKRKIKYRK